MTTDELRIEHAYRYQERLGIMEVWGTPLSEQHNLAVEEANQTIKQLRKEDSLVAKLRALRESL